MPASKAQAGAGVVAVLGLLAGLAYYWRPLGIVHGPVFLVSKYPLVFLVPLVTGGLTFTLFAPRLRRSRAKVREARLGHSEEKPSSRRHYVSMAGRAHEEMSRRVVLALGVSGGVALASLVAMAIWVPMAMKRATFEHYAYVRVATLPEGGEVRVVPKEVADTISVNGYVNSGFTLGPGRMVLDPKTGRLAWSYEQAPGSWLNRLRKPSQGIALLDAQETRRVFVETDREFRFAPGMRISENTRWQILKRHFFSAPTTAVAVRTATGEPIFVQPYIVYRGFPIRYPVVGGVMVFHPGGRIEDISVEEAAKRPEIVATGRIVPEGLAREIQDAYAYKSGAWNAVFSHRDQTQIVDDPSSDNRQPYLMAFRVGDQQRLKWVSSAEPRGRSVHATKAVFLTDATTGETEVWSVARGESLTGAQQSIQTVKATPVNGVLYGNEVGRYTVVEPRPVFLGGKLHYMLSVIPYTANKLSLTAVVDPAENRVVALFNHDTDADADTKLIRYLRTGRLDPSAGVGAPTGSTAQPGSTSPVPGIGADATTLEIVDSLIKRNRELQAEIARQQAELEQLRKRLER